MFNPAAPRRPFTARGSHITRCEHCQIALDFCICDMKPRIQAHVSFWLMMHHDEVYKPSNTGRLIVDTVDDSHRLTWSRTEPDSRFLGLLDDHHYQPCVVFPSGNAHQARMVSADELLASGKKPALILLDGTWRQAGRMFRLSRYFNDLPVIEPLAGRVSRYNLRQAPSVHQLSTAEVAAALMEDFGDVHAASMLNAYFDLFNAAYYASRCQAGQRDEIGQARARLEELMRLQEET